MLRRRGSPAARPLRRSDGRRSHRPRPFMWSKIDLVIAGIALRLIGSMRASGTRRRGAGCTTPDESRPLSKRGARSTSDRNEKGKRLARTHRNRAAQSSGERRRDDGSGRASRTQSVVFLHQRAGDAGSIDAPEPQRQSVSVERGRRVRAGGRRALRCPAVFALFVVARDVFANRTGAHIHGAVRTAPRAARVFADRLVDVGRHRGNPIGAEAIRIERYGRVRRLGKDARPQGPRGCTVRHPRAQTCQGPRGSRKGAATVPRARRIAQRPGMGERHRRRAKCDCSPTSDRMKTRIRHNRKTLTNRPARSRSHRAAIAAHLYRTVIGTMVLRGDVASNLWVARRRVEAKSVRRTTPL